MFRPATYSPAQKFLHWAIVALVVVLFLLTYAPDLFPRDSAGRDWVWWLHISFGMLLAVFVAARIAVRAAQAVPAPPADAHPWEVRLAAAAHALLYLLLVALPVAGILLTWMRGDRLSFFGLFTVPAPFAPDPQLAHRVKDVHELLAYAMLTLAAFHGAAALWHHFVRRDDVLRRMLPGAAAAAGGER